MKHDASGIITHEARTIPKLTKEKRDCSLKFSWWSSDRHCSTLSMNIMQLFEKVVVHSKVDLRETCVSAYIYNTAMRSKKEGKLRQIRTFILPFSPSHIPKPKHPPLIPPAPIDFPKATHRADPSPPHPRHRPKSSVPSSMNAREKDESADRR
jgi:hypothetical protein